MICNCNCKKVNIIVNQINYELIKEENFTINLCKNVWTTMILLMSFTHNEGKSVISERFIGTLKAKFYKKLQLMIENLILVISIN